jgi:hypothetical protein
MTDESPVMGVEEQPQVYQKKNDHFPNVNCTGRVRTWEHHLKRRDATVQALRY